MNRRVGASVSALIAVSALAAGCGQRSQPAKLTELQRLKSGTVDVVLLSARDGLHHGRDTFLIEFRSSPGGNLIDVGDVRASGNMPMSGMPMFGTLEVK